MPWLRGNLHAHTTFSDGVKEPAQLVAAYEALGYDFLAITDHETGSTTATGRFPGSRRSPPVSQSS
jgi:predicted metal-dependent phosphoesterase TrpH